MIDFLDNIYAGACQSEAQPPKDKDSKHLSRKEQEELVNSPKHYQWLREVCGIEPIDICRHPNFNRGNALKYLLRAGRKQEEGYTGIEKEISDIKKALWYLQDELNQLIDKRSNESKD